MIETNDMLKQIEILFKKYKIDSVKIGMVKDMEMMNALISELSAERTPLRCPK